jgi:hypothetical protein
MVSATTYKCAASKKQVEYKAELTLYTTLINKSICQMIWINLLWGSSNFYLFLFSFLLSIEDFSLSMGTPYNKKF